LRLDGADHQLRVVHEGAQRYKVYLDDILMPDGRLTHSAPRKQEIEVTPGAPD
jgi:hypothetical protein